jgi:hypothetical protein
MAYNIDLLGAASGNDLVSPSNIPLLVNALASSTTSSTAKTHVLAALHDLLTNHSKAIVPVLSKETELIKAIKTLSKANKGKRSTMLASDILKMI